MIVVGFWVKGCGRSATWWQVPPVGIFSLNFCLQGVNSGEFMLRICAILFSQVSVVILILK